ncbi:electron transport complex subunit RsxA [candidate division WOR-3 bacterium]|uniref:Ion-translocating oxidoreductase complex subunit A n=1 Tax=candidate division WOR-3 bacterium TaxID=2052148 RepID=A0A660SE74_UNCW3|nr:MAG: electron transport complex subunit RsxA [candidate division WOR-3 bacterium]
MSDLGVIFIGAFLVNNIVLMRFLGLCPFFGVSTRFESALGMGMAVIFVMTMASWITWFLYHVILLPMELIFLRTAVFILVIASLVQLVEMFLKKSVPALYSALGIYLPLITTNCAILAVTFLNIDYEFSPLEATTFAIGTGIGFTMVLLIFASIRERLDLYPIPRSLKGHAIAFIAASLVSLAFLGFVGLFGIAL